MDNRTIAARLTDLAHDLEDKKANLYRIRAYRRAAQTVLSLTRSVEEIVNESGRQGLRQIHGIGASLSETIELLVRTGTVPTLNDEQTVTVEPQAFGARGSTALRVRSCCG